MPASSDLVPCWNAADPEAQAFSTRVDGTLASCSETCSASEDGNASGIMPELNWPR